MSPLAHTLTSKVDSMTDTTSVCVCLVIVKSLPNCYTHLSLVAAAMSLRTIVKTMKRFYLQSVRLPLRLREAEGKPGRSLPPIQTVHIIEDTRECEDHMSKLMETRIKAVGRCIHLYSSYVLYVLYVCMYVCMYIFSINT